MKSSEEWSSQLWSQFLQLRKEAWKKFRTSTGLPEVLGKLPREISCYIPAEYVSIGFPLVPQGVQPLIGVNRLGLSAWSGPLVPHRALSLIGVCLLATIRYAPPENFCVEKNFVLPRVTLAGAGFLSHCRWVLLTAVGFWLTAAGFWLTDCRWVPLTTAVCLDSLLSWSSRMNNELISYEVFTEWINERTLWLRV